jgi:hypothetical protein
MRKTMLGMVVMLFIMISACKKESTNPQDNKPVACFTVEHDTISEWEKLGVNAACSKGATSYNWWVAPGAAEFTPATGVSSLLTVHQRGGSLQLQLAVANSKGVDTISKSIFVREISSSDWVGSYTCNDTSLDNGSVYGPYTIKITTNGFYNGVTVDSLLGEPKDATISNYGFLILNTTSGGNTVQAFGSYYWDDNKKFYSRFQVTSTMYNFVTTCAKQ